MWEKTNSLLSNNHETSAESGIDIVAGQDERLVSFHGRIDIDSSPPIRDRLLGLLQDPDPKKVSIDLSAVTHIDSSGVATLIEALRIARGHEIELKLLGLHGPLLRLFELTGILSLFNGSVPAISQSACKGV